MLDQAAALFDGQRNWVCPLPVFLPVTHHFTCGCPAQAVCYTAAAAAIRAALDFEGDEVLICFSRLRKSWMRPQ